MPQIVMPVKTHALFLCLVLFILMATACGTDHSETLMPTVQHMETAVIAAQFTSTLSPVTTETAVHTSTPTPTKTPSLTWTPWPTQTDVPIYTPSPKPTITNTPTPFPTATIGPLPQGLPTAAAVAGIGTVMPQAASVITADNVSALTEVARWGKGNIHDAAYSPDGKLLYALTSQGLYVYDAATAKQIDYRPYTYTPREMSLSTDGQTIAMLSQYNYIELRDAASNTFITSFSPFSDPTTSIGRIDFDQSGNFLFFRSGDRVMVWDIAQATIVAQLTDVDRSNYSPEAARVITAKDGEDVIKVWQWQDKAFTFITELNIPESINPDALFYDLAISPNGDYVALSDLYLSIAVWQVSDNQLLYILNERKINHQGKRLIAPVALSGPGRHVIWDLQFSPNSQLLAEATGFQDVTLWRVADGKPILELEDVGDQVVFKPDNTVIGAWNYTLSQWTVENGRYLNVLNQHMGPVNDLALLPDRGQLAIASADSFVYLRLLHSGDLVTSLRTSENSSDSYSSPSARAIDVTANGDTLVFASNDTYGVWNLEDFSKTRLQPDPDPGWGAANIIVSNDGQYIIGKGEEFSPPSYPLILWETDIIDEFEYMSFYAPTGMAFSPTDLLMATTKLSHDEFSLVLLQPESDVEQDLLLNPDIEFFYYGEFVFSTDGRFLASTAGNEGTSKVVIWAINNNLEAEFKLIIDDIGPLNPRHFLKDIAFTPDNHLLALLTDWDVRIFDVDNGRLLYTLPISAHGRKVLFSADGRYLITGHSDGSVRFWAMP